MLQRKALSTSMKRRVWLPSCTPRHHRNSPRPNASAGALGLAEQLRQRADDQPEPLQPASARILVQAHGDAAPPRPQADQPGAPARLRAPPADRAPGAQGAEQHQPEHAQRRQQRRGRAGSIHSPSSTDQG